MSDELGKYIDLKVVEELHDESSMRQYVLDQSSAPPTFDSLGILSADGTQIIIPSGDSFSNVVIGTPGPVDATVRLAGNRAVRIQESTNTFFFDDATESWYIPLFNPAASFIGPAFNTDTGWWLKKTDTDKAYRLPFELLPTQTSSEYQSQTSTGAVTRDAILDSTGQHLIMLKSQRKFTNPYTTDYFGYTCGFPCPGGGLPANPVSQDLSIYVQYAVFKNFTLNDGTLEVDSDNQIFGNFLVDGSGGYTTRADTFVPGANIVDYRLIDTSAVRSMQWCAITEGSDVKLQTVIELEKFDFIEADVDDTINNGYAPSGALSLGVANNRKHFIYRKYALLSGAPTTEDEYSINTSTIMPFLGFTESGVTNTWAGFKVNHTIDRMYGFNGSFIVDFAPIGISTERRLVFFDNDQGADSFAMTLLYSASGGASSAQAPPYFNISHAAYSTYDDLPVTVPTPEYIDIPASNVIVETIDESTLSVIENVDAGNADFMFYPNSFKKMTYNTISDEWESESVTNDPLDGSFTPAGLVYRNRLTPLSSNRAIMSRIFRAP